jgi:single-stranded-DNA-specific exonuclease
MKWKIQSTVVPQDIAELRQLLLTNREITDPDAFFSPPSPLSLSAKDVGIDQKEMKRAVKRIHQAGKNKEKIVVFGDYDADGVCATAILWQVLHALNYQALPFIPQRDQHGYGLSVAALEEVLSDENRPSLIITVDNGIVAHPALAYAHEQGVEVILTDHHQPDENKPQALAVVHTTRLCGATVSWMLAKELVAGHPKSSELAEQGLDLCGIATIADQVPLRDLNRQFAFHGLKAVQTSQRAGLKALFAISKFEQVKADSNAIGFGIAPRINAMGRLAHGLDALRLLCTSSLQKAQGLAALVSETNTQRQDITMDLFKDAQQQALGQSNESIIIVHSQSYHEGVIGLIAGRLAERHSKPAIVVSLGEKVAKASARSVPGVNVVELIRVIREHLLEVGGHPMAAGFGFESSKLTLIKELLMSQARASIAAELLVPCLEVECELPSFLVSQELALDLEAFAPFGQGNPEPAFFLSGMKVRAADRLGKEGKHLKLMLLADEEEKNEIAAIGWGMGKLADEIRSGDSLDLVGTLQLNHWNGKSKVQLMVRDVRVQSD